MTQQAEIQNAHKLKKHIIWQDGRTPDPCVIVLFGATGDLAQRKILPTLAHLIHDHPQPEKICIVAFARRPLDDDAWRSMVLTSLDKYMPADDKLDDAGKTAFAQHLFYCQSNFDDSEGYKRLGQFLAKLDQEQGTSGNRLFYLATPPDTDLEIIAHMGEAGLAKPMPADANGKQHWVRLITEKPFGHDLESAQKLNQEIARVFHEGQVFRIDHYMGKETVQNIIAFRFANGIFEPLWNQKYIDHVQIVVAESLGIESRAEYYETAGAIKDIVQNHVMQILSLIAMESPAEYSADDIRDEKVKVLRAIRPLTPEQVAKQTVRGQYTAGMQDGKPVVGYKDEKGVSPTSTTETYVALKLFIENWRWADVPFYIRTGKHLPVRSTEVTIQFKRVPHQLYTPSEITSLTPNTLILRIQPDEGISLKIGAKVPGASNQLTTIDLAASYNSAFDIELPDAYERLIADCIIGDSTLFIRRDEIECSWRIIDSITSAWKQMGSETVYPYAAGTWGPREAETLITEDGRKWLNPA
ncbi:glucose-6-phosphate dehydrogenase [Dictyobacter arantiisoli]|uniref:Glucose-6-phosphate 1-dehydrogenase n=1 Tax=Dictyobacter arantiisoli TaxID=2014874 RepID=A0A5A5T7H3_9CHLR|nr:glucose-6-phosphate dehydrogenase [Dictyobacter arantiisoli]GCF07362.1 glucose-6-phosphate 1-dehydrogenase [Dictyobacter arantiisoli]